MKSDEIVSLERGRFFFLLIQKVLHHCWALWCATCAEALLNYVEFIQYKCRYRGNIPAELLLPLRSK